MPYKDLKKRREKNLEYTKAYGARQKKIPGICSVIACSNRTTGPNQKCDHHLAYMREYKKKYRARKKPEGVCTNSDCTNKARPGFKLCESCNERSKANQKLPKARAVISARRKEIKREVISAYGGQCACCGEAHPHFMSIDHIDGYYENSPRKGSQLYRWLLRHNFPPGFRVLCMSCNFALGRVGYCSHSNLTCAKGSRRSNPASNPYYHRIRQEVFEAYGGYVCACCGETTVECLSIDHIENDGPAHRKELTGDPRNGTTLYYWLRKNGFPTGFQVLCMNCNFAKGHFGKCPHEQEIR